MGTSVWFETLQQADWGTDWEVDFFNVNIHQSLDTLGKTRLKSISKNLALLKKLKRQLKATHYQLVLIPISQETIGFIKDSLFIRIAAKRADKVLLMLHGSNFLNWQKSSSWAIRKYTQSFLKRTDGIVVLGNNLKMLFEPFYSLENIHVVPNGADFSFPDSTGKKTELFDILYLSNLQPSKGIEDVIEAIGILKKNGEDIRLTVVGQWRDELTKKRCLEKVKAQQLPVVFVGPVYGNEKLKYFSQADVFVFPPRAPEGHPLVLVEAMAAGLPIISTDQGAIKESVLDTENGFIIEKKNPEQLAEKITWLLNHSEESILMGKKSKEIYEAKFTANKMIDRFKETFTQIIQN